MSQGILGAVLGGNKKGGPSQQGGLSGIIGALGGQQTSNQQPSDQSQNQQRTQDQGQATKPQNAMGDLVNQVLGGKKKKPPQQPPQ
jgi:hypothetical protein